MVDPKSKKYLAEFNIARLRYPQDDPRVAEFIDNLDRINRIGMKSPGFVWMMTGGEDQLSARSIRIDNDEQMLVNLTVWETIQDFEHFVWNTVHRKFFDRREEWFDAGSSQVVMWWVNQDHTPTLDEAMDKLERLRRSGPSQEAFDWDYVRNANP